MTPDAPLPVVLVTGGNRGIGLEIAKQLAGRGYHAVAACRNQAKGEAAVKGLREAR
ncbi:SDR family NAD(P)-dependent oxidoreductase [Lacipirellula limnantheis]|uniref:Short chain dehydrogenase n=1 Tax=Lacipirellula limnantheis TaxID=2528024 RepID=A0A517U1L4_9BACT|nr:SDR family NAD(P)-dependent oxidoreductase [Lacipirellula limnantheis]QDT74516.1 short chain dehydrogenase [Lacipirellula limnantheis]